MYCITCRQVINIQDNVGKMTKSETHRNMSCISYNHMLKTLNCIHFSGVAMAFPGGRLAHPEGQNGEENK